jgi:AraC-like DNA-binding protein
MHRKHFISNQFLQNYREIVREHGGNALSLAQYSGVRPEFFENTTQLIPLHSFVDILEKTASKLDIPDIALRLAQNQNIHILGPLCNRLARSEAVADAVHIIAKHLEVIVSGVTVVIKEVNECLAITFTTTESSIVSKKQYQDYALATAYKTLAILVGSQPILRSCHFLRQETEPRHIQQYKKYFNCPIAFESGSLEMFVDANILKIPVRQFAETLNLKIKAQQALNISLQKSVSDTLLIFLMYGSVSLEQVASALNYHPRTLQRQLAHQGLKFSELLESVRLEKAKTYLTNTSYSLEDISGLAGYRHLSGFSRSFKRKFGLSPLQIRKQSNL